MIALGAGRHQNHMEKAIMNIAKLAENRVMEQGEQATLIFEGRAITNVEMLRASKKLATALKDLGVKRGDRVILQMPNCPMKIVQ